MDPNLKQQLTAQFNLYSFSETEQEQMLREMSDVVTESILTRAIPRMSPEDGEACDAMLASDADIADVMTFIAEKVPEFQTIISEEVANLKSKLNMPQE